MSGIDSPPPAPAPTGPPTWLRWRSEARKFGIALLGFASNAVAAGVVPEPYKTWVVAVIGFATAVGVFRAGNTNAGV